MKELVIKVVMGLSNEQKINLKINPTIVLASRDFVNEQIKTIEISKANKTDLNNYYLNTKGEELNTRLFTAESSIKTLNTNKANNTDLEPIKTQITNLEDSKANKTELTNLVKEEDLNTKLINYIQKTDVKVNFQHYTTLNFAKESEIINAEENTLLFVYYYSDSIDKKIRLETSKNQESYFIVASGCAGPKSVVLGYGHSVKTINPENVKEIEIFKISLGA